MLFAVCRFLKIYHEYHNQSAKQIRSRCFIGPDLGKNCLQVGLYQMTKLPLVGEENSNDKNTMYIICQKL